MTYDELIALVEAEIIDLDDTWLANKDRLLKRAQLRIENDLDLDAARVDAELIVMADQQYTLPDDLVLIQHLRVMNGDYLEYKDRSYLRSYWPNPAVIGNPKYYSYVDDSTLLVAPTPPEDTEMELSYTRRLAILSPTAPTNWLSLNTEDLLQYSLLLELAIWTKDAALEATYKGLYSRTLSSTALTYNLRKRTGEYETGAPKARVQQ